MIYIFKCYNVLGPGIEKKTNKIYISSVYSPFSDRVVLPLHNILSS